MKGKFCKSKFIELLEETPNIAYAARGVGVARATIYRWMGRNKEFNEAVMMALQYGHLYRVDAAEMALLSLVAKGDFKAIRYYLEHHSEKYKAPTPVRMRELGVTEQEILQVRKDKKKIEEAKEMSGAEYYQIIKNSRDGMDALMKSFEDCGLDRSTVKGKHNFPPGDLPPSLEALSSSPSDDTTR